MDYGNKEPLKIRKLRMLNAQFQSDEMFAVPVSLANVRFSHFRFFLLAKKLFSNLINLKKKKAHPIGENWSPEAIADFQNLTIGRFADVKVRREADWPILFCSLTVNVNDV